MARNKTLITLAVVYAATMTGVLIVARTGWTTVDKVSGPVMVVFGIVSVIFAGRAARHPGLDPRTRRAAWVLTIALTLALATPVLFLVSGPKAFPRPGDGTHMAFVVVLFAAVQMLPRRRVSRRERWKTVLDSGTVLFGASMVIWYLVIGPAVQGGHDSRIILAAAAYPVVDLLALFGFARVLLRGTGLALRRPLRIFGGGVLAFFVGDAYLGYTQAHEASVTRTPWQFACWLTMHFLLAGGAVELWRQASHAVATDGPERNDVASKLPYAGVAVGYLLMALAALHEPTAFPWVGLVLGGMGITGQVVLRQLMAQHETAEAAATDGLTGLANRARLHRELTRATQRAARGGRPVAVLLIDLNGFKQVNDTLGHQVGDGLLVAVADAMRRSVRPGDLVGRLGGDEFAVVVQSVAGESGAVAIAQRIVDAIAGPFVVGDRPMSAAASIGVAVSDDDARTADALLHRADVAMYDKKRRGSGWQAWHPALEAPDGFETDLAAAVSAGQLRLTYRPVVALSDGLVVGADATLSWEHPERGPIGPDVIRPIAERIGVAEQIEAWTLREAVAEAARTGHYVGVAVTRDQLRRPGFVAGVRAALDLSPYGLVLHLPESVLIDDPAVAAHLSEVRALGVRVAVRDFGTAYASLRALSQQPVDLLVLDDLGSPPDAVVVEAVVRLSQSLGLGTLAGGVEIPADATDLSPLRAGLMLRRG